MKRPPTPVAAVVGTGFIGPVHVEALRRLGVRVKGVLGSSAEKSRRAAVRLGVEVGYVDFQAVVADPEVTTVHLASPNRAHREQVLRALASRKHVVCEKPLALTTAESAELVAAAAAHPAQVCAVSYNVRFYPQALQARALVAHGEIGEVLHVQGSYFQDWLLYPEDFNWRVLAAEGGALRAVGDIGTHWLDLVGFITGLEVESVMADLRTVHPMRSSPPDGSGETFAGLGATRSSALRQVGIATEDYGAVLLRFRGGARGVCAFSQVAAGRKNCIRFEISGAKRSLAWNSESPEELWIGERGAPNRVALRDPSTLDDTAARFSSYPGGHAEGYPDTFKQLHRAIYDDIAAGRVPTRPLYATFADGHRELQLCDAIAESHHRAVWVQV